MRPGQDTITNVPHSSEAPDVQSDSASSVPKAGRVVHSENAEGHSAK